MNARILAKALLFFAVMAAVGWGVTAPRKGSPYASALGMVTVRTANAAQCDTYCSAPQHAVCLTTTQTKKCINGNGQGLCKTLLCNE
jgi:hypothetical protein